MAQLNTIGWVSSEPRQGTSANGNPYVLFSLGERVGYGQSARTQFYQVWARGDVLRRLTKAGIRKGSLLFVSGSLELEEYAKSDGAAKDKRLRLELSDWSFVPGRERQTHSQKPDASASTADIPSPDDTIDGERDTLPE